MCCAASRRASCSSSAHAVDRELPRITSPPLRHDRVSGPADLRALRGRERPSAPLLLRHGLRRGPVCSGTKQLARSSGRDERARHLRFDAMNATIARGLASGRLPDDSGSRATSRAGGNYLQRPDTTAGPSQSHRLSETERIEAMDNLIAWLANNIPPAERQPGIVPRPIPPGQT